MTNITIIIFERLVNRPTYMKSFIRHKWLIRETSCTSMINVNRNKGSFQTAGPSSILDFVIWGFWWICGFGFISSHVLGLKAPEIVSPKSPQPFGFFPVFGSVLVRSCRGSYFLCSIKFNFVRGETSLYVNMADLATFFQCLISPTLFYSLTTQWVRWFLLEY